jgi:hypothetical protein
MSMGMVDSAPATLMPSTEKALPALPLSSTPQKRNLWPVRGKRLSSGASDLLIQLGPVYLCVGRDWRLSTAYLLQIRSTNRITLFRTTPSPSPRPSSYLRTSIYHSSRSRPAALYDISRSEYGQRSSVVLDSKARDNLSSEPSSRLKLRRTRAPGNSDLWELFFHRNYEFESLIGVPAPGSRVILFFDSSQKWRGRSGKAVAEEGKGEILPSHQGVSAGSGLGKLSRIDISGGLDERSRDLLVACWVAKAYFL